MSKDSLNRCMSATYRAGVQEDFGSLARKIWKIDGWPRASVRRLTAEMLRDQALRCERPLFRTDRYRPGVEALSAGRAFGTSLWEILRMIKAMVPISTGGVFIPSGSEPFRHPRW